MWVPSIFLALIFLPLLFPTGRPCRRRWRPVAWFGRRRTGRRLDRGRRSRPDRSSRRRYLDNPSTRSGLRRPSANGVTEDRDHARRRRHRSRSSRWSAASARPVTSRPPSDQVVRARGTARGPVVRAVTSSRTCWRFRTCSRVVPRHPGRSRRSWRCRSPRDSPSCGTGCSRSTGSSVGRSRTVLVTGLARRRLRTRDPRPPGTAGVGDRRRDDRRRPLDARRRRSLPATARASPGERSIGGSTGRGSTPSGRRHHSRSDSGSRSTSTP